MIRMRHSCRYAIHGCGDSAAANYVPYAGRSAYEGVPAVAIFVHNRSMCQYSGCNDSAAANFDSRATFNDGTCRYRSRGCMDPTSALYLTRYDESCAWATPPPAPPRPYTADAGRWTPLAPDPRPPPPPAPMPPPSPPPLSLIHI